MDAPWRRSPDLTASSRPPSAPRSDPPCRHHRHGSQPCPPTVTHRNTIKPGECLPLTDYAEDYLQNIDFYRFLDDLPEDIRHYVSVDVEQYAEDMACELHVADTPEGRVWVFDVR